MTRNRAHPGSLPASLLLLDTPINKQHSGTTHDVEHDAQAQSTLKPREQEILVLMNELCCCLHLGPHHVTTDTAVTGILGYLDAHLVGLCLVGHQQLLWNQQWCNSNTCAQHTPIVASAWTSQNTMLHIPWHCHVHQRIAVCIGYYASTTMTRTMQCCWTVYLEKSVAFRMNLHRIAPQVRPRRETSHAHAALGTLDSGGTVANSCVYRAFIYGLSCPTSHECCSRCGNSGRVCVNAGTQRGKQTMSLVWE
jgi:hypothetical protein